MPSILIIIFICSLWNISEWINCNFQNASTNRSLQHQRHYTNKKRAHPSNDGSIVRINYVKLLMIALLLLPEMLFPSLSHSLSFNFFSVSLEIPYLCFFFAVYWRCVVDVFSLLLFWFTLFTCYNIDPFLFRFRCNRNRSTVIYWFLPSFVFFQFSAHCIIIRIRCVSSHYTFATANQQQWRIFP